MATIEPRLISLPDGTRVIIRSPSTEDWVHMESLRADLLRSSPHQVSEPTDPPRPREVWEEKIRTATESPGHLWLAASLEADPAILGSLEFHNAPRSRIAHHGTFGIGCLESWRGRGIGRILISTLLDWAVANPIIEKVCLQCFATNTGARKLYRRIGFRTEMRQRRFIKTGPGEYIDDIGMSIYVKPGIAPRGFNTWVASDL